MTIVTGAGGDLGRGMALHLAQAGASVLVNDCALASAEETCALVRKNGGKALADSSDVTDPTAVAAMVESAAQSLGGGLEGF